MGKGKEPQQNADSASDAGGTSGLRDLYLQALAAEAAVHREVGRARTEGASWRQIAQDLGVSKSVAKERFGSDPGE